MRIDGLPESDPTSIRVTFRLWTNTRILRPWLGLVWVREVDRLGDTQRQYVKRWRPEEWTRTNANMDRPWEGALVVTIVAISAALLVRALWVAVLQ